MDNNDSIYNKNSIKVTMSLMIILTIIKTVSQLKTLFIIMI